MAETKTEALVAFDGFTETWGVRYGKAGRVSVVFLRFAARGTYCMLFGWPENKKAPTLAPGLGLLADCKRAREEPSARC
jgi:hypothetical protein